MPQGVIIDLKWMDWAEIIKYHLCLSVDRILLAFNVEGLDEDFHCQIFLGLTGICNDDLILC